MGFQTSTNPHPIAIGQYMKLELSGGEICVANFIPPANGASLGSYLAKKQK